MPLDLEESLFHCGKVAYTCVECWQFLNDVVRINKGSAIHFSHFSVKGTSRSESDIYFKGVVLYTNVVSESKF